MPRAETLRYAFNRGLISPLALGRVDLKRSALAAEICSNWIPRLLGPMMLRPGLGYLGATYVNRAARYVGFVRASNAKHLLEFTTGSMRVWTSDEPIEREAVSSAITNGNFDANLGSWTDADEVGGTSAWVTGGSMGLTGNGSAAAIRYQQVSVAGADQNVEHALRIAITRGPVVLRVGSTLGGDEYINEVELGTGQHSLAFTPAGASFYVQFQSRLDRLVLVNSCQVEGSGVLSMDSPYLAADLDYIRANAESLSVDVQFVACRGYQQRRIERRASGRSWSIVLYQPEDGPFRNPNTGPITLAAAALSGNTTLTASAALFRSGHLGALFQLTSTTQNVTASITAQNTFTNAIRVTGVGTTRAFSVLITGLTGTGSEVTIQQSATSATGPWVDYLSYTTDQSISVNDGLDNQIIWYRIGVKTGDYAAGTIVPTLNFPSGSITGIGRITTVTSSTVVDVEVLQPFGATDATDDWAEGMWSDYRGWPSAGTLVEGRMGWAGYSMYALSVSDAFDSYDAETEGDSGPIVRSIGSGPLETINWMLALQRLILGGQMAEHSVRSNTFDEPLTPTNNNRKPCSDQGSAPVQAIKNGARGFYVQRGGTRVMEMLPDTESLDYASRDTTLLCDEVGKGGDGGTAYIVRMALQQQPDARLHVVLSNGTVAVLIFNNTEKVECWVNVEAGGGGLIEDVVVLPGDSGESEDHVYYQALFSVNGANVRYLMRWATEAQCQGGYANGVQTGAPNRQADAFVLCTGGSATLTGLDHLEGEEVVVWANNKDLGSYTVSAGQITVTEAVNADGAIVGLEYQALFQSAELGNTLTKHKNLSGLGLMLRNTHCQGLEIGQDFTTMDNLPLVVEGRPVGTDDIHAFYHQSPQAMPGKWNVDARLCLRATAPRPATVMVANIEGEVS